MRLHEKHIRYAEYISILMALGVFASPYVFNFAEGTMLVNSMIVGAMIMIIAAIRTFIPTKAEWLSWVNLVLGLWLFMSPFILLYTSTVATWGAVFVGLVIVGIEFYSATETHTIATR